MTLGIMAISKMLNYPFIVNWFSVISFFFVLGKQR